MKIDIHAHTTNNRLQDLHVKTATISDLEKSASEFDTSLIVLMATYFPFKRGGVPNREILKRIAGKKLFKMFLSLDAMNKLEEGMEEIRELIDHPQVLGIKLYPGYQDFDPGSEKMYPLYELARQKRMPVGFHSGELHLCCPKNKDEMRNYKCKGTCRIKELQHLAYPQTIAKAAEKFPEVNFILCHMGNPYFSEMREVMEKFPNIYTDISGQFLSGVEDTIEYKNEIAAEIRKLIALPNEIDRIMFGTDFPIQSYADSIELVKSLHLSKEDEEKIFSKNAIKLFNLE